ncbi:MAG: hypothetical protein ACI4LJ_03810, partial [Anaerovoracaceae bacterium]
GTVNETDRLLSKVVLLFRKYSLIIIFYHIRRYASIAKKETPYPPLPVFPAPAERETGSKSAGAIYFAK